MPQPRRSSQGKRGGASGAGKTTGPKASSAGKSAARHQPAAKKPANRPKARAGSASASSKARAGKAAGGKAGGAARKPASKSPDRVVEVSGHTVAELRQALSSRLIDPLELVMLTRERIEEALDDAVTRGRVTAEDAQALLGGLLERGRRQTSDVLADLEGLLSRGRDELEGRAGGARKRGTTAARRAREQVGEATARARKEAAKQADPVLAKVDQARRAGGVGSSFPITGYDDLTAAQVQARLSDLTPAELRKVRDYERRHANRKTVLNAIEQRLG